MHSVPRSPEPDFWQEFLANFHTWDDLGSRGRSQIRDALARDFGPICVYCERPCSRPTPSGNSPDEETIEHFRPRSRFPNLTFDWDNLVYACYRCNQRKGEQWPGYEDGEVNRRLTDLYPGHYISPVEYPSPNLSPGRRPAQEFFTFDFDTGEMLPDDDLDPLEWSSAVRTIRDVDLNDNADGSPGENDPSHLWNRRLTQLNLLLAQLLQMDDWEARIGLMREFSLPDKPFSGFIAAYARSVGLEV